MRGLFLDAAALTRPLIAHPKVGEYWDEPSALAEMPVGSLAAHLGRSVGTLDRYLRGAEPPGDAETLDAPGYFLSFDREDPEETADLQRQVRERAAADALVGHGELVQQWDRTVDALTAALAERPPGSRVEVLFGMVMLLDDYLVTRLVEMLVHADDLAVSLRLHLPDYPAEAWRAVEDCLVEMARRRHGDVAVVRALARRERDAVEALRVI